MKKQLKTRCRCGVVWDIDDRVSKPEVERLVRYGVPECTECCHPDDVESYIRKK